MSQRGYAIAFFVTVILTCAATLAGIWLLWGRVGGEFRPRGAWTPADLASPTLAPSAAAMPSSTASASRATATRPASPTSPRPTTFSLPSLTPWAPSPGSPAPTATPSRTPTAAVGSAEPTPQAALEFESTGPVRHTTGDCPGVYILGRVTDASGNPLAGVRLWLVDEYGNEDSKSTKAGPGELGWYDFPLFGPPRRFYLTVVDASGHPISSRVEIGHGLGAAAQASCHWVDWRRR